VCESGHVAIKTVPPHTMAEAQDQEIIEMQGEL